MSVGGGAAPILETRGLHKTFGAVTAAHDISVSVARDSVVGLIGSNGAGKTTFINMVTGWLRPSSGQVLFEGRDITGMAPRRVTQAGICRSFQIPQLFNSLSVHENLLVGVGIAARTGSGSASGRPEAIVDETLERFGLGALRGHQAGLLPEGTRKLLDIAMAMAVKPRILLLDEPTSGVSADEKFTLMDMVMRAVREHGVTVLFVEHDMDIVERYVDRVLAFYDGRIIADAPPAEALANAKVREFVIGDTHAATAAATTAVAADAVSVTGGE
jgi:branched-chain amino acid transport system ATP-binding protein